MQLHVTVANFDYRPTLSSLCILLFKQRLHKFDIGYTSLLPASVRRSKHIHVNLQVNSTCCYNEF